MPYHKSQKHKKWRYVFFIGQQRCIYICVCVYVNLKIMGVYSAALSSCAHVKELIRTKQDQFTLEQHALHEEHWTLEHIMHSLQPCSEPDNSCSLAKFTENSESHLK